MPLWLTVLDELSARPLFVIAVRNPLEVAASLKQRDGFLEAKSVLLWLGHFLAAERDTRGFRRVFVAYEHLLGDWRSTVDRIQRRLGVNWPRSSDSADMDIENSLSSELRHQRFSSREVYIQPQIAEWVKVVYDWSMRGATDRPTTPKELDAVSAALETADTAFMPLLVAGQDELQATRDRLQRECSAREDELQNLRATTQELTTQFEAMRNRLQAELDGQRRQVDELIHTRDDLRREMGIIKGSRSWRLVQKYWEWKLRWLPDNAFRKGSYSKLIRQLGGVKPLCYALGGMAVCTWLAFRAGLNLASSGFLYLVFVALAAVYGGFWQAALTSVVGVACLDYFFTWPLFSFGVNDARSWAALGAFEFSALIVTRLIRPGPGPGFPFGKAG